MFSHYFSKNYLRLQMLSSPIHLPLAVNLLLHDKMMLLNKYSTVASIPVSLKILTVLFPLRLTILFPVTLRVNLAVVSSMNL